MGYGFERENIHVFDYSEPEKYASLDIDVIYISGGNTFATLECIRKCGFDREIIRYIQSGVTYIGGSAGAHIVCNHIKHVAQFDSIPEGVTDLRGLGLFDGYIICHFTAARQVYYTNLVHTYSQGVYTLTDDQSILIQS